MADTDTDKRRRKVLLKLGNKNYRLEKKLKVLDNCLFEIEIQAVLRGDGITTGIVRGARHELNEIDDLQAVREL